MNEDAAGPVCERTPLEPGETGHGVCSRESATALSPSLWKDREEPAFEIKFQLSETKAKDVAAWAAMHLNLDPHADPMRDNCYFVNGLYFDTAALDVFHRAPGYKKKKYRLRRYGEGESVFLEQKRKSGGRVAKRRIQIAEDELDRLRESPTDIDWVGHWFHRRINVRNLQPSCLIGYQRQAYFGQNGEGPLRLTLDRNVRCRDADRWAVEHLHDGVAIVTDQVLLELKFRKHLPTLFKVMMQDFALTPGPLSKYRLAIQALGKGGTNGRQVDG